MADISTTYMGLSMKSPVIVGASTFSKNIDNIKRAEDAGAGAIVIHSLFQEQIELERLELDEELAIGAEAFAEATTFFPHVEHAGAREHTMWIEKTRKEVSFPIIGSINARSMGDWVQYASELEQAGCDALELNIYSVETHTNVAAQDIEKRSLEIVSAIKSVVKIPVAVKLSPFYTSVANFAARVVEAGADGVVLFNRFYQPYIDPTKEKLDIRIEFSRSEDTRLPMRWIAILSDELNTDLAASTGIHTGEDAVRQILAGARVVESVSTFYMHGLDYITEMNNDISRWMGTHGYANIEAFRGKLSRRHIPSDPSAFERAQYIEALIKR